MVPISSKTKADAKNCRFMSQEPAVVLRPNGSKLDFVQSRGLGLPITHW